MKEIYKDIIDFPKYEISNLANVRTIKSGKLLKQTPTASGYYVYCRDKNDKPSGRGVHRLVAVAFVDNPNNYPFVSFIDNDQYNPVAANLKFEKDRFTASKTRGCKIERKEYKKSNVIRQKDELWLAELDILDKADLESRNYFKHD